MHSMVDAWDNTERSKKAERALQILRYAAVFIFLALFVSCDGG